MDNQDRRIDPNALAQLMQASNEMNNSTGYSEQHTPQVQVQMSAPESGSRQSRQADLRAAMRSNQNQAAQAVTMTQGSTYEPTTPSTPTQPTQQPVQQPVQVNPEQATRTVINTTRQKDKDEGKEGKKINLSKGKIFGAAGAIVVLLVVFLIYKGKSGNEEKPTITSTPTPELDWIIPEATPALKPSSVYTIEQIESLRAAGYTGEEIESFALGYTPYDALIEQANKLRDDYIQEAIAPLYDTASEEYKKYISSTWLTLPKRNDTEAWTDVAAMHTQRKNLDYEKIDVYGNQLFLKIYLDDDAHEDWFFLLVTPVEWNKLNDRGNVIVNYSYMTRYVIKDEIKVEDFDNIYIVSATLEIIE